MYVRIHHNDRPMSLIGGYQGMFVSITMINRLSLLGGGGGGLSKYICIYHNDGPTSLIGGLFRSLEFRPLLFMIDRRRLLGGYQSIFVPITMMDPHLLFAGYLGL